MNISFRRHRPRIWLADVVIAVASFAIGVLITTAAWPIVPATSAPPAPAGVTVSLPCEAEDGRRDAQPCLWVDPSSGVTWVVDSSEYLD